MSAFQSWKRVICLCATERVQYCPCLLMPLQDSLKKIMQKQLLSERKSSNLELIYLCHTPLIWSACFPFLRDWTGWGYWMVLKKIQDKAISLQSQSKQSSAFKAAWSYWRSPIRQRTRTLPFSLPTSPEVNHRNAALAASVEPELLLHLREGWMEMEEQLKLLLQQCMKALQS